MQTRQLFRKTTQVACKRQETRFLVRLFTIALVMRVGFALVLNGMLLANEGPAVFTGGDEALYLEYGRIAADLMREGQDPLSIRYPSGLPGYYVFSGLIYFFLGGTVLSVRLFQSVVGAVLVMLTYKLARECMPFEQARVAGYLAAFLPHMVLFSTLNLRDIDVASLICLMLWQLLAMQRSRSLWRQVFISVLCVLGVFWFRPVWAVPLAVTFIFALLVRFWVKRKVGGIMAGIPIVGIILIGGGLLLDLVQMRAGMELEPLANFITNVLRQQEEEIVPRFTDDSLTGMLANRSFFEQVVLLPVTSSRALVTPIPLTAFLSGDFADVGYTNAILVGNLVWVLLLPAMVTGGLSLYRQKRRETAILLVLVFTLLAGIGLTVYGQEMRWRLAVIPPLLMFAGVGLTQRRRLNRWYAAYLYALLVVHAGYLVAKAEVTLLIVGVSLVSLGLVGAVATGRHLFRQAKLWRLERTG